VVAEASNAKPRTILVARVVQPGSIISPPGVIKSFGGYRSTSSNILTSTSCVKIFPNGSSTIIVFYALKSAGGIVAGSSLLQTNWSSQSFRWFLRPISWSSEGEDDVTSFPVAGGQISSTINSYETEYLLSWKQVLNRTNSDFGTSARAWVHIGASENLKASTGAIYSHTCK